MDDTISIIIPTFNRAHTITKAVESVVNQSSQNLELVIIDDGSTDNTKEVLKLHLSDKRIKYFYQFNQGVAAARNKGVELSKGNYLIFLDSDDTFFPDLIKNLNQSKFYEFDLICWQVLKIINGKKRIWKAENLGGMYNYLKVTYFPGSICYSKEIFLRAGGFDPKMSFGENYELGIRVSELKNIKIKIIDKVFLKYEMNTLQRTSNSLENRLTSHIHQLKKHKFKYNQNLKAKSEMNYIIGFVLEKSNRKSAALGQYKDAWKNDPLRIKAILKIIYLKFFG